MELYDLLNLMKKKWHTIMSITVVCLLLAILITIVQPLRHRVTSKILIVQRYGITADAYSISRANQYLTNILSQVISSDSFFQDVMNSGFDVNKKDYFSADLNTRRDQWQEMVDSSAVADTGMIIINTYHQDKAFATQLNQAIVYTLKTNNSQYHGLGNKIEIKVIDNALSTRWPVKPNIITNTIVGILAGLFIAISLIYNFPDKNFEIRLWRPRRKKYPNLNQQYSKPQFIERPEPIVKKEEISGRIEEVIIRETPKNNPPHNYRDNNFHRQNPRQDNPGYRRNEAKFEGNMNNLFRNE
jgi:capsular polysaccharide biosynthesis protein